MKETYVIARFPNGQVLPCIIRRESNPALKVGNKIITSSGTAVCVTEEIGRYIDEGSIEDVANAMDMNKEFFPVVKGQIYEEVWDEKE